MAYKPQKLAIANGGTNATSFTQSNGIVTYNGTSLVNYAGPQIDSSGRATNTTQPCFLAYPSANLSNVTGDGTVYQVAFNATQFDVGSAYDTSNFYYVAPVAGKYFVSYAIQYQGLGASHTNSDVYFQIGAGSNYIYEFRNNPYAISVSGVALITGTAIFNLSANDHILLVAAVYGGTKTVTIGMNSSTDPRSYIAGYLIA